MVGPLSDSGIAHVPRALYDGGTAQWREHLNNVNKNNHRLNYSLVYFQRQMESKKRIVKMLLALVVEFFICSSPLCILAIWKVSVTGFKRLNL